MSDLPRNLVPPQENPGNMSIEEIVSPVQPSKDSGVRSSIVTVCILLVATFALGYVVYGHWPQLGTGIKVAKAPVEPQLSSPVAVAPSIAPSATEPAPRTSSTSTETPNVVTEPAKPVATKPAPTPAPTVLGATTTIASRVYTDASGFSITLPARTTVNSGAEGNRVVEFRSSANALLARVEVADLLLDDPSDLGKQLALSPNITKLENTTFQGYFAYRYMLDGAPALAVVRGNRVYYITDYSARLLSTFGLK